MLYYLLFYLLAWLIFYLFYFLYQFIWYFIIQTGWENHKRNFCLSSDWYHWAASWKHFDKFKHTRTHGHAQMCMHAHTCKIHFLEASLLRVTNTSWRLRKNGNMLPHSFLSFLNLTAILVYLCRNVFCWVGYILVI